MGCQRVMLGKGYGFLCWPIVKAVAMLCQSSLMIALDRHDTERSFVGCLIKILVNDAVCWVVLLFWYVAQCGYGAMMFLEHILALACRECMV